VINLPKLYFWIFWTLLLERSEPKIGWSGAERWAGVAEKRWSGAWSWRSRSGNGAGSGGYRNRLELRISFYAAHMLWSHNPTPRRLINTVHRAMCVR